MLSTILCFQITIYPSSHYFFTFHMSGGSLEGSMCKILSLQLQDNQQSRGEYQTFLGLSNSFAPFLQYVLSMDESNSADLLNTFLPF